MGNLTGRAFAFGLAAAAVAMLHGCGSAIAPAEAPSFAREQELGPAPLRGTLRLTGGGSLSLEADSGSPQVLIFASETCSVCHRETVALASLFRASGPPVNVSIYSVLVGSTLADARAWQASHGANWAVAADLEGELFRAYCPEAQTPCVLARHPERGTRKFLGEHGVDALERQTGTWRYL